MDSEMTTDRTYWAPVLGREVYEFLEKHARPFEAPIDVLRRLLGMPVRKKPGRPKKAPQKEQNENT